MKEAISVVKIHFLGVYSDASKIPRGVEVAKKTLARDASLEGAS